MKKIITIYVPNLIWYTFYKYFLFSVYLILSLLFTMFVLKSFHAIPELKLWKLISLQFNEPNYYKNVSEYQILFGKEDNSISKLYAQDSDNGSWRK